MYPNQNITPGVAWSQGIQKVIDQQDGYRAEANAQQAGYNQGYNKGKKKGYKKGVSDAWLHANEEIAALNQTIANFKQALSKMNRGWDEEQEKVRQLRKIMDEQRLNLADLRKKNALLTRQRDIAEANYDKMEFVARSRGDVIERTKSYGWHFAWREALEPKAIEVYQKSLTDRGYSFKQEQNR